MPTSSEILQIGIVYLISYLLLLILFEKYSDRAYQEVVAADISGEVRVNLNSRSPVLFSHLTEWLERRLKVDVL